MNDLFTDNLDANSWTTGVDIGGSYPMKLMPLTVDANASPGDTNKLLYMKNPHGGRSGDCFARMWRGLHGRGQPPIYPRCILRFNHGEVTTDAVVAAIMHGDSSLSNGNTILVLAFKGPPEEYMPPRICLTTLLIKAKDRSDPPFIVTSETCDDAFWNLLSKPFPWDRTVEHFFKDRIQAIVGETKSDVERKGTF